MPCNRCGRTYTGLACDCFLIHAAKEAAELQLRRFRAGEINGYAFNFHIFLEESKAPALCGAEVKRRAIDAKIVSAKNLPVSTCQACRAVAGER